MVSAYAYGLQSGEPVHHFRGIRPIADDVSTAQDQIVTGPLGPVDAGFQRFHAGMDVTEDEIAHGVSWVACDSRKSWESLWFWRC